MIVAHGDVFVSFHTGEWGTQAPNQGGWPEKSDYLTRNNKGSRVWTGT